MQIVTGCFVTEHSNREVKNIPKPNRTFLTLLERTKHRDLIIARLFIYATCNGLFNCLPYSEKVNVVLRPNIIEIIPNFSFSSCVMRS
jgi:hypothetical protein